MPPVNAGGDCGRSALSYLFPMNTSRRRFLKMAAGLFSLPAIAVAVAKPEPELFYSRLGIRDQLAQCSRVIDAAGSPLTLKDLEDQLYALKRWRADNPVDTVEFMVTHDARPQFLAFCKKVGWELEPRHTLAADI